MVSILSGSSCSSCGSAARRALAKASIGTSLDPRWPSPIFVKSYTGSATGPKKPAGSTQARSGRVSVTHCVCLLTAAGRLKSTPRGPLLPEITRPRVSLDAADAGQLAEMLQFLSDWLARDPDRPGASLEQFVGHPAYGTAQLRDDLKRFFFLLSGSDGEHLFRAGR